MGDQVTDQQAAKTLAQHIAALRSEQADMTRYLFENNVDPWSSSQSAAPTSALFTEAIHSTTNGDDWKDKQEKVRIAYARRACAALVLDALLVAKNHCDDEFRGMVVREMYFAEPRGIFRIDDEDGRVGGARQGEAEFHRDAEGRAGDANDGEEGEEREDWNEGAELENTPRRKRKARY